MCIQNLNKFKIYLYSRLSIVFLRSHSILNKPIKLYFCKSRKNLVNDEKKYFEYFPMFFGTLERVRPKSRNPLQDFWNKHSQLIENPDRHTITPNALKLFTQKIIYLCFQLKITSDFCSLSRKPSFSRAFSKCFDGVVSDYAATV